MKSRHNSVQFKPYPRTAPLNDSGSKGDEKGCTIRLHSKVVGSGVLKTSFNVF